MTALLSQLVVLSVLSSPLADSNAVELRYRGALIETGRESNGDTVKRFNLYCLVSKAEGDGQRLAFLVDESGGGSWAWPEQYGQIDLDAALRPTNPAQIRLLYTHEGEPTSIRVRRPLFEHHAKLAENANWTVGNSKYSVVGSAKVQDWDCWRVEAVTNFGLREELAVEKQTGLIVSARRDLTRGKGVPFSLSFELQSSKPLEKADHDKLQKPISTLAKLQADLKRPENEMNAELTSDQLKVTELIAEQLQQEAEDTPYARLAASIRRDLKRQMRRYDDVEKLSANFVGKPAPEFSLQPLRGETIDAAAMKGNVVVLHFWDYKYDPLVEPYGQAPYLDYSFARYKKLGVQVYGVAVNSLFSDANTRGAALQSTRKFKSFMNLSYPLAIDAGELVAKFGDPRRVGAKLPLWVVIGADGNVAHYSIGFYDINPDEGLRPLDKAVGKAVRAKREAKKD